MRFMFRLILRHLARRRARLSHLVAIEAAAMELVASAAVWESVPEAELDALSRALMGRGFGVVRADVQRQRMKMAAELN